MPARRRHAPMRVAAGQAWAARHASRTPSRGLMLGFFGGQRQVSNELGNSVGVERCTTPPVLGCPFLNSPPPPCFGGVGMV